MSSNQNLFVPEMSADAKGNAVDLRQKTFLVISGASRGIGRMLAIECAAKTTAGSLIVLLARSTAGLEETKAQILAKNPNNITVMILSIDLTRPTAAELKQIFDTALYERNVSDFQLAMIIHNVGTVGDVTKLAKDFGDDESVLQDYYAMNVFSVIALNRLFLALFDEAKDVRRVVVNITSMCAIKPCKSFTLYCSGKAAREMYFRVLALEEAETDPNLLILNYSPGPVDTEMTVDVQANSAAASVRSIFETMRTDKSMLQPIDTTKKFLCVLEADTIKSGDRVDYYD